MNIGLKTLKDKTEKNSINLNSLITDHDKFKCDIQAKINELEAKIKEHDDKVKNHESIIDSIVNN